jgi:protein phosphatase
MQGSRAHIRFYEDSNFGKSPRRFYEDRLKSGRVTTASGLVLDLAVVADGIGGENAGERAAEMTVEEVFAYAKTSQEKDIPLLLQTALEFANAKVYLEAQRERHKQDMGTTAAVAAVHNGRLYIANVGDSRIYLVRSKQIHQLTRDHTWGNEMVLQGALSPQEASRHIRRDELMRSIGYEPQILVDTGLYIERQLSEKQARHRQGLPLHPGDRVLVCSDGLIKQRHNDGRCIVEPHEIIQILADAPPGEAARLLVDKALERGTDDNVSVALLEWPAKLRPLYWPQHARAAFLGALGLGLIGLGMLLPAFRQPPAAPTLPPIEISQDQAYISKLEETGLQFIPTGGEPHDVANGDFVDFLPGAVLRTQRSDSGYAFIGLPGRAELFMAPDSEVRLVASDDSGVSIQLQSGRAVVKLQNDFPVDRRLMVFSPEWAKMWISSSSMCVWYEQQRQVFNADCVEHGCGYENNGEKFIAAGYHLEFQGTALTALQAGLRSDVCQFVPGLVATATPTATTTQMLLPGIPQVIIVTPTPRIRIRIFPPTATATRFPTLTPVPPSSTPTSTAIPTDTPPPPTDTIIPTDTETLTPWPTDTPNPTPTDTLVPTDTPTETPTDSVFGPAFGPS